MRLFSVIAVSGLLVLSGCKQNKPGTAVPFKTGSQTIGTELGNIAPDLELSSPEGHKIKLSSLRGKMVLVDFWASWCLPCRMENPNVVKVYRKFKNESFRGGEGFAIYSVSLDTKEKRWKEAIRDDGMEWDTHVSDLMGWNSDAAARYQVSSIPSNYLINGQGVIIARDLRADALESTIKTLLK